MTNNESSEEKTIEEILKEEATQYYNLAKDYRRDRYLKEDSDSYIINKEWLKKWKEYVNYSHIKKSIHYSYYYNNLNNKPYEPDLSKKPGEIENSELLVPLNEFINDGDSLNQENMVIRHDINQREKIKIVNKTIWEFLQGKYKGGPEIIKGTIEEKSNYASYSKKIIELYHKKFDILLLPKRKDLDNNSISSIIKETIFISRTKKCLDLKSKIISLAKSRDIYSQEGVTETNLRLWKINTETSLETFKKVFIEKSNDIRESATQHKFDDLTYLEYNENSNLEDIELADTDLCIVEYSTETSPWIFEIKAIEIKDGKCEWCNLRKQLKYFCACKDVWYCKPDCLERDKNFHKDKCKKKFEVEENNLIESDQSSKGLTGLQNLGNTCFMNTSLQCVSNCYELTQYFLKDYYKDEINTDNPIGTGGILAKAYANLLKNLWYGQNRVFSPWNFKRAISTFQSMFSGYQQHDTQEFLNYLLDGLHEDLNRVLKKPMVDKDESNKDDKIKSAEHWVGFLRRNQSVLVDLLYGQYKSTLYCPDENCQNVSTTFDPFLSISLPLVSKTETYETTCFFIFYDIKNKPVQLNLQFSSETTIMALRNKVAKLLNIHPFSFFVIKMDKTGNYDCILNTSSLIRTNAHQYENQKAFFIFQMDPDQFYSKNNKFFLEDESIISLKKYFENDDITEYLESRDEENKKLFADDYEEDENGTTSEGVCYYSKIFYNMANGSKTLHTSRINTDDNYGFSKDLFKTVLYLKKYDEDNNNRKVRIIFPRIIYLNKNMTTVQAHFYIFKYFSYLVRSQNDIDEKFPDDELWNKVFSGLETNNENDSFEYQKKNNWPYRLRLVNTAETRYSKCYYCDSADCENCLLPFSKDITIGDLLKKIPMNDDLEIDNTYLYLKGQRNMTHNKDFQIEVCWLPEYDKTVHKLNDKRDYDFKVTKSAKQKFVYISDCFKNFVKLEKLEENNEWYCPQCKTHRRATKKMEIYKAPHILIVHLKRFRNNAKIDTLVDFPVNGLDISSYVISNENNLPLVYDLFAIANHFGGMGFGHYTSYAKNPLDNQWYDFDDSSVSRKSESDLVSSSAYVLFYRRRDLNNYLNLDEIYNKKFVNYENSGTNTTESQMKVDDENSCGPAAAVNKNSHTS